MLISIKITYLSSPNLLKISSVFYKVQMSKKYEKSILKCVLYALARPGTILPVVREITSINALY
jgi:hypothetical protein